MANNPMFGTASSPTRATAPTNSINDSKRTFTVGRNTFNYSRPSYLTARYADITPFECVHGVEGDILEFGSRHGVRSHTLKSPLESKIHMKKTYVQVDMKAILPRNWNRFYINPTSGDDVVAKDVNTFCPSFFLNFDRGREKLRDLCDTARESTTLDSSDIYLNALFHYLVMYEHVFSSGSLLSHLGMHTNAMCVNDFDLSFESLITSLKNEDYVLTVYTSDGGYDDYRFSSENFHNLLSAVRYNHSWSIRADRNSYIDEDVDIFRGLFNKFKTFFNDIRLSQVDEHRTPLNYDCLAAYQISCATFYSRDSLDTIFSAETYRDIMDSLWRSQVQALSGLTGISIRDFEYDYNGQYYLYDALSGKVLDYIVSDVIFGRYLESGVTEYVNFTTSSAYAYFMNLFGYCQSLRYGDYFTGSKPRPLAVGDVTAEVNNGAVNAIDMTVALARARFLNDVNRVGRRPEDYIDDITDGQLPPEITEPRYLASVTSTVSGFEVENTAEHQGDIVTILKSGDSNQIYSLQVGHPCIVLGLLSFEIQRVYTRTIDRFFFHEDRFDMFNKYLQRIGDQSITRSELDAGYDGGLDTLPFSYTLRNMEYKQRYPIASGGFVKFLPGYLFITDSTEGFDMNSDKYPNITPEYLRSRNSEIDRFYVSLSNYSLAGYYHFILSFDNICIAHRKMDYTPSIL